jgi:hypothetical protein
VAYRTEVPDKYPYSIGEEIRQDELKFEFGVSSMQEMTPGITGKSYLILKTNILIHS